MGYICMKVDDDLRKELYELSKRIRNLELALNTVEPLVEEFYSKKHREVSKSYV